MKAYVLRAYGAPSQLDLTDVGKPVPRAGEVLVRVRATSVNPYDWHGMRGEPYFARLMAGTLGLRAPKFRVLGCDMAGQVEAVGEGVTALRPGDDVFALLSHGGGFAEYVSVPQCLLARMPRNLSYEQAAAVPMAAATALLALREAAQAMPGQRILVNGASGGVGTFAVQIARALGATADAVCSSPNADLVRSIGAADVIDYTREDFTRRGRRGRRYDVLLDIAGGHSARACGRVLAPKGTLVLIGGPAGRWLQPAGHMFSALAMAPLVRQRIAMTDTVSYAAKKQALVTLTGLIEDGKIAPVIGRRFPFHQLQEAVRYQERGHVPGKVVVTV
jgi:NADPH:quinone reductase-like Zn-dependent oxidoreductase